MEKEDSKKEINSGWELFRFCLGSRTFDLLLVLMMMFVWHGTILLRQNLYGKDSTAALLVVYIYPVFVGVFSIVMFGSMKAVTRKIEKSAFAEILFALMMILIPLWVFFYFPLDVLWA